MWKFLESEKLVILGLTEDASRTDAEIADLYGIKKGTVASVRRRLVDAGAISFANVPALNKLGCEMICFHSGSTEPSASSDVKASDYAAFCEIAPQVFHGLIGGASLILFTALRNATEHERFIQSHNKFFTGNRRTSKARLSSALFPFAMTRGVFVPSYAPAVHRYFELDVPPPKPPPIASCDVEEPDLSRTESETLLAMIENPSASDREISSIVKLSRQAITRIRNSLVERGIVTRVCIPKLYKWGFEIYVVAHPKFNMELAWDRRLKSQPRDAMDLSFYTLSKPDESVSNYNLAKFMEYSEQLESMLAWYHKMGAFEDRPELLLFTLERSVELRAFDFGPAVRNLLLVNQASK